MLVCEDKKVNGPGHSLQELQGMIEKLTAENKVLSERVPPLEPTVQEKAS
jgi:hypothetical protein